MEMTAGIVRILGANDATVGTGFVISDTSLITTCAHVVEAARASPGDTIHLAFCTATKTREAVVEPVWWRAPDAEDVAILRLRGTLPQSAHALPLARPSRSKYHPFETVGFPAVAQEGMWGTGQILGTLPIRGMPMIQLRSQEVTVGFSGAPVWDQNIQKVIGMISAITPPDPYGRQRDTVFAVSTELLIQICPELEYGLPLAVETEAAAIPELRTGEQIDLQGRRYLIRELIAQKPFGTLVVRTARAAGPGQRAPYCQPGANREPSCRQLQPSPPGVRRSGPGSGRRVGGRRVG